MAGPRMLIEGIGGIGGVVAARLLGKGHEPVLVTGNPTITQAIQQEGLRVTERGKRFTRKARALTSLEDLPADSRFDVALLIMKADRVVQAARRSLSFLEAAGGFMVTCQNGIVEDAVAKAVGAERVVSGIVGWGGTMHAPGVYEKTGPGAIHLGELDGGVTERLRGLASVLECVSPVVISTNIRGALWSKLAINCTITTLGALTGQTLGRMLRCRRARQALLILYREVVDTAEALGIRLERIATNPRLLYLPRDAGPLARFLKDKLVQVLGIRYRRLKSSSLQSLERGRKTEIDYLNGYVVERAQAAGVEVPLNAALFSMVHEIEAGTRTVEPGNMEELLTSIG